MMGHSEGTTGFTEKGQRTPVVIELLLAQYRMSRLEEIVTTNAFRGIWVVLSVYAATATVDRDYDVKLASLLLIGCVLYVASLVVRGYGRRQASIVRKLLLSAGDDRLRDFYIREFHIEELREAHFMFMYRRLVGGEETIWFCVVLIILGLRVMAFVGAVSSPWKKSVY